MDTLEFFRAVLPPEGPYFLAFQKAGRKGLAHKSFASLEVMAEAVAVHSADPELTIYHACASYKQPFIEGENGKREYRKEANWSKAKALWVDVDCGEEKAADGKGYARKKEAAAAVLGFAVSIGLPAPMLVDSGNGLHCYWPTITPVGPNTWRRLAGWLKALLAHHGVLADPSRTADFASILRPVGSIHRKGEPRLVKAKTPGQAIEPLELHKILAAAVSKSGLVSEQPRPISADLNDDLTAHLHPQIPTSAKLIAEHCSQMMRFRDTKGDLNYEVWRGLIGIIKHCTEGIDLAREWSVDRHINHEQCDVDHKYTTWNSPPTSCEFLERNDPDGCAGCKYKGKIKSPIVLGRTVPEEQKAETVEADVDGQPMAVEIPEFPTNFRWENGQMVRYMQDKDNIWHAIAFADRLFYPIHRIEKSDTKFAINIRMHMPKNKLRDFMINTSALSSSTDLGRALFDYELLTTNNKDAINHMSAYLKESLKKLMEQAEHLKTMSSFGWKDDMRAFLIGDRLYRDDGSVTKVLISGPAAAEAAAFEKVNGSVEKFAEAVNFVYANPGMEPLQYAIASSLGSALTPLYSDPVYRGLLVALTGGNTAKGKTTAAEVGLSMWGNFRLMKIAREGGATVNGRWSMFGAYNNLPILIDEITHIPAKDFSELAYTMSIGIEKRRMRMVGGEAIKAPLATWAGSSYTTANTDLASLLASGQHNSEAEAVRFVQIKIDNYPIPVFPDGVVARAASQMEQNSGAAGDKFLRYVVPHVADVMQRFDRIERRLEGRIQGATYRYYRGHAACTLVAAEIATELGIFNFNQEKLFDTCVDIMQRMIDAVKEQNIMSADDALNTMIKDLMPRIINSVGCVDQRGIAPEQVNHMSQPPVGRWIRGGTHGQDGPLAGRLYLVKKDVQAWCLKNRIEPKNIVDCAKAAGALISEEEKFTIGKGTQYATASLKCLVLDMRKLEGPQLTVHQGGKEAA